MDPTQGFAAILRDARKGALLQRAPRSRRDEAEGWADRLPDRLQPGFDLRLPRLQERRQRQLLAELIHRLVRRKTWSVGGDLEQDAVRLAEIKAAKIEPVDLAGVADAEFVQPPRPGFVLHVVGRPKRDVMHAARALPCRLRISLLDNVQLGGWAALAHRKHVNLR